MLRRTNHFARNEKGLLKAISNMQRYKCPTLVGPSFETDGHQLKLMLLSSFDPKPGPHGITKLPKRGYQVRHCLRLVQSLPAACRSAVPACCRACCREAHVHVQ